MPLEVVNGVWRRPCTEQSALEALPKGVMGRALPRSLRHAGLLPRESHLSGRIHTANGEGQPPASV